MTNLPKRNDDGFNAYVSYTQINKFNMCQKAWEYRYVEGIKGIMPGRVKVGSAFDRAANAINELIMTKKTATPEAGIEAAAQYMADPGEEFDETDIASDDNLTNKINEAVGEYVTIMDGINICATQCEVNTEIAPGVTMTGYIDTVEVPRDSDTFEIMITDNKSTLKKRSGKYTHDTATTDLQLNLYAAMYRAYADGDPVVARGWRVIDLGRKTPGRIEEVQVRDTQPDVSAELALGAARASVNQMESACETGLFAPTGRGTWLCSANFCEFYNRCPYGSKSQTTIPIGKF